MRRIAGYYLDWCNEHGHPEQAPGVQATKVQATRVQTTQSTTVFLRRGRSRHRDRGTTAEARRFAGTPRRLQDPDRHKMIDVVPAADGDGRPAERESPRERALRKPQGFFDVPTDTTV